MNKKILLIIVLAIFLRCINLGQSLWLDETAQAVMSSKSVSQIWFGRSGDFQPPLFYFLSHLWLNLGRSEAWLRMLPVIFGVLGVVVMIRFANDILPTKKSAGLIAGFLLAINSYHIYYSQEFRMYSLVMLLGLLAMWSLHKKHWTLFIFNALLLYSHYSSVFLILAQIIIIFIFNKEKRKYVLGQLFLTTILYVPWLPQLAKQVISISSSEQYLPGWKTVLTLPVVKSFPEIIFKLIAGRINIFPKWIYALYIAFVLGTTCLAFLQAKEKRSFLLTWIFAPILLSIGLSFVVPQTQAFRLIFILPGLILLITQACLKYPKLFLTIFIYISIVGNVLYLTRPRLQREQWRQAIAFVQTQPGQIVVKFPDRFAPFVWYASELPVQGLVSRLPVDGKDVESQLANVGSNIYLFDYLSGLSDPENKIENKLNEKGYINTDTKNFEGVGFIRHYQKQ